MKPQNIGLIYLLIYFYYKIIIFSKENVCAEISLYIFAHIGFGLKLWILNLDGGRTKLCLAQCILPRHVLKSFEIFRLFSYKFACF
ncbi:jg9556, partial [Pararge aegeria aegeria]